MTLWGLLSMLLASACESEKGHMAAMGRLLTARSPVDPSADELAHESVAVKMVQREMSEADEVNLLEEEDMHVFDREPLADRLPLVACNTCNKPVKASQYSAHAERCRLLSATDETVTEIDGGANHKKPPRKARKKLLISQDNLALAGERERLQSVEADDTVLPDSGATSAGDSQDQFPVRMGFTNFRGQTNGSLPTEDCSGAGAGCTSTRYPDGILSTPKRVKMLKHADLNVMCGVLTEQGAPCRHPLTCKVHCESSKRAVVGRRRPYEELLQELKASLNRLRSSKVHDPGADPMPMTTKIYYLRHHHRMRAVLGSLFQEACAKYPSRSCTPSPDSVSIEHRAPTMTLPAFALDSCVLEAPQQMVQSQASDKMQFLRGTPGGNMHFDQSQGLPGGFMSMSGILNQPDSRFSAAGALSPNSQFLFGKGHSVSPLLGVGGGGVVVNGTQPPPFGGVQVT